MAFNQCLSEAKCYPGRTVKAPPFPHLKFALQESKIIKDYASCLVKTEGMLKHLMHQSQTFTN